MANWCDQQLDSQIKRAHNISQALISMNPYVCLQIKLKGFTLTEVAESWVDFDEKQKEESFKLTAPLRGKPYETIPLDERICIPVISEKTGVIIDLIWNT